MKILIGVAAVMLAMMTSTIASTVLLNGNTVTNWNVAYNSGTNTSGVVTNNYQNGQVPGASNVFYALNVSLGAQPLKGTNGYLPAFVLNSGGGYPGALNGPSRMVAVEVGGSLMATNASSTAVVFQIATSVSGINWVTNYTTIAYTVPVNSFAPAGNCIITNIDMGGMEYIALQQINNPGVSALTNIIVDINCNPGL